jgi:hypothetical protein
MKAARGKITFFTTSYGDKLKIMIKVTALNLVEFGKKTDKAA